MSTRRTGPNVLGIYLNDHLAGATAGTELARRAAGSAQDREDMPPSAVWRPTLHRTASRY